MNNQPPTKRQNFIRQLITTDLATGRQQTIVTRFPPEPNGYLHIGHAKSICLNFGLAEEFNGICYLRFDDTNPIKEEEEYVNAIIDDVRWLGFKWHKITYSSDYYQELYDFALYLIKQKKAYVDSLNIEEIRAYRGSWQEPGKDSPYRNRPVAESLELFARMKAGDFANGEHVLRARIDMQATNINMRDPVMYRIRHATHQRTKNAWCIYPMYDYAHPVSDALEKVTHSLCTLEFQDHRPLYDWFINNLPLPAKPIQTEFARLNLSHTVTSKRKLKQLVDEKIVTGWSDPRLPTLQGLRRRGYPPAAIKQFCAMIGISRADSIIDITLLEDCVRAELNKIAKHALCVLDPLKIIIDNYPVQQVEELSTPFDPNDHSLINKARILPFCRELYIERSDFMLNAPKNFFRLTVGAEVRLRHAYIIRCIKVNYDQDGNITTLICHYDHSTLGKNPSDRKVKGVIHWVSCQHAQQVKVIEYDRLFKVANPASSTSQETNMRPSTPNLGSTDSSSNELMSTINKDSIKIYTAYCEPAIIKQPLSLNDVFQFERLGYYCLDQTAPPGVITFQRIVSLKDTWGKLALSV